MSRFVPFTSAGEVVEKVDKVRFGDSSPLWTSIQDSLLPGEQVCGILGKVSIESSIGWDMGGVFVVGSEAVRHFTRKAYKSVTAPKVVFPLSEIAEAYARGNLVIRLTSGKKVKFNSLAHLTGDIIALIQFAQAAPKFQISGRKFLPIAVSGYPVSSEQLVELSLAATGIRVRQGPSIDLLLDFSDIETMEVGGAGLSVESRGGGMIGGGFGIAGFAIGAASAALYNKLTTRTDVNVETLLRIETSTGELNLFTSEVLPQDLENELIDARSAIRGARRNSTQQSGSATLAEQISQVQQLFESGVLSEAEFQAAKQKLLGS